MTEEEQKLAKQILDTLDKMNQRVQGMDKGLDRIEKKIEWMVDEIKAEREKNLEELTAERERRAAAYDEERSKVVGICGGCQRTDLLNKDGYCSSCERD